MMFVALLAFVALVGVATVALVSVAPAHDRCMYLRPAMGTVALVLTIVAFTVAVGGGALQS